MLELTHPKVILSQLAFQKITHWVDLAPGEISGLGVVEVHDDHLYVPDVYLLKQECSDAETEIDQMAMVELVNEWIRDGNGYENMPMFWWHSHVNMSVFWSKTDEECISRHIRGDRFLLSTVFNKRGETRTRLDFFNNQFPLTIDKIEFEVEEPERPDRFTELFNDYVDENYELDEKLYRTLSDFTKGFLKKAELEIPDRPPTKEESDLGLKPWCEEEFKEKVTTKIFQPKKRKRYVSWRNVEVVPDDETQDVFDYYMGIYGNE